MTDELEARESSDMFDRAKAKAKQINDQSDFDNAEYYDCCGDENIPYTNSPDECICDYIDLFAPFDNRTIADVVRDVCPITVRALAVDEDASDEDYAQFGEEMRILKEVGVREYSEQEVIAILNEEWGEEAE